MDVSRSQAEATRLLPLAQRVLSRYDLALREVEHLATHSNVLFRVVAENGHQMVLRVGTPHANYRSNIEIEVSWLDALYRETGLDVVQPIATADGRLIIDELDENIEKERACVLFSWVPGRPMGDGSGSFAYRLLGTMCAALQQHGRTWVPPGPERMRLWDVVFYYQEDFDPVIINNPLYQHLFDTPRISTIRKAMGLAQDVLDDSYATFKPQVVHGDLHEWNVHVASSRLYAFDFEDVMLALPAQDVAICLYSSRSSEMRDDIRAAFRKGYESVVPWPVIDERQLDGFHAARQIMLMNYAGRTLRFDDASEYLDKVMPWLERYVKRYG
jgi:Ser/Thr protein kinase RdoA (MazF antagonist)